jgi:hypothetical protein
MSVVQVQRVAWFIGLWVAGVLSVAAIGMVIRFFLSP